MKVKIELGLCSLMSVLSISAFTQNTVEPLLTASWHQSHPFNDDCPEGTLAGYGAIAVAQILNHYKAPAQGFGRVTYENVDVNFESRPIDWDHIIDNYSSSIDELKKAAVANLVYPKIRNQ
jgi:hypothetical protein